MNLTEAAEIVRRNSVDFPGPFDRDEDRIARFKLTNTMLAELDMTPITEEWLADNGWELTSNERDWLKCNLVLWRRDSDCWDTTLTIFPIKTLGKLCTLLRLMVGGE